MQRPFINFDDIPLTISEFFSQEDFASISYYERQHLSNLRQNFEALRRAGFSVHPPEFMLQNKLVKEKDDVINPLLLESSDGSDSEWTPALERTKKPHVNQRKPSFKPPRKTFSGYSEDDHQSMSVSSKQMTQRQKQAETDYEEEEVHVYPFRKKRMTSYMSLAIPDDEDFIYCEECNQEYDGDCPLHGALYCVGDAEVPLTCPSDSEYSKITLPEGLVIKCSKIPKAGLGVFAVKDFPARTRFGPYTGKIEFNEEIAHKSGYSWQIMKDGQTVHFVDAKDSNHSNWMRFVNCARHEDEQCVTAYQYKGEIYYRSHVHIFAGTEILVYYGDSYAKDLGIHVHKFCTLSRNIHGWKNARKPSMNRENERIYSCSECQLAFSKFWYLQKHMKYRHKGKYWKTQQIEIHNDLLTEDTQGEESKPQINQGDNPVRETAPESNNESRLAGVIVSENLGDKLRWTVNDNDTGINSGLTLKNKSCVSEFNQIISVTEKCVEICVTDTNEQTCINIKSSDIRCIQVKPFKCDVYSSGFTHHANLKKHKRIHTGEKPYKCDVCSAEFTQCCNLKQHKRIHTGEKPYKCDVCSAEFTQCCNLKQHKRIHTGEKPYKCDVCSAEFTQCCSLKQHKRIHTGEKPYKCDVCSAEFTQCNHLKQHKRIHTGEKPYKCDVCSAEFTQCCSLKKHKRIHTGEKPYKCDVCSAEFALCFSLKQHKRIHTGEKPYKCDVCSAEFTQCCSLKTHMKKHNCKNLTL